MEERAQLCLFGTQGADDPLVQRRACLENPSPAPTGSQIPPTLGQLLALITALSCSNTSSDRLPCSAFKAFQDLVPGSCWLYFSDITLIHLPFPAPMLQSFPPISDYLMNILTTRFQCTRVPGSSLKPVGAREELGHLENGQPYSSSLCTWRLSPSS